MGGDGRQVCEALRIAVHVGHDDRLADLEGGGEPGDRLRVAFDEHIEVGEVVGCPRGEALAECGCEQGLDVLGRVAIEASAAVGAVDDELTVCEAAGAQPIFSPTTLPGS